MRQRLQSVIKNHFQRAENRSFAKVCIPLKVIQFIANAVSGHPAHFAFLADRVKSGCFHFHRQHILLLVVFNFCFGFAEDGIGGPVVPYMEI